MDLTVRPLVTVVIPARNEAAYIEACVRSVVAQNVDGGLEVLVLDGRSSDATAELARAAGATVIENEQRGIPSAMNLGLAAARGEILLRFDAHAEMPGGYVEACVRALREERAVNVGGWCDVRAAGPWGRALGAALASTLGVGNPRLWRRPQPPLERRPDVDSVPFGCFRADAVRAVGGWRGELQANEDFELNHRLRAAGGRIVFDPAVAAVYKPRESLPAIGRQYWNYGRWKAAVLASSPRSLRPRQLAPPALFAVAGAAILPSRARGFARRTLAAYCLLLAVVARRSGAGWRTAAVLATVHAAWGAGLLCHASARAARRLLSGA